MANHVIGRFNVGPAEKFVAVFLIVFTFAFTIAIASAINSAAVRRQVTRIFETSDVPGLK